MKARRNLRLSRKLRSKSKLAAKKSSSRELSRPKRGLLIQSLEMRNLLAADCLLDNGVMDPLPADSNAADEVRAVQTDSEQSSPLTFSATAEGESVEFITSNPPTVNEDAGPQTVNGFARVSGAESQDSVIHDEGAGGTTNPLSTNNLSPTNLGVLASGSNIVRGHIDSALSVGDVDIFSFTVAPGSQLDGLFVEEFGPAGSASDTTGFLGINDSGTFPLSTSQLNSPNADTNQFIGGTTFGVNDVGGGDILGRAGSFAGSGFTGPLGPGTYTVYVQQTGPATEYSLSFNVSGDPVIHDEGSGGTANPLSTNNLNPTNLGALGDGSNIVRGHIDSALSVGDVDIFSFTVSPGSQLDGLFVEEFGPAGSASDTAGFLAINDSGTFPLSTSELNSPNADTSQFIGGTTFGLNDLGGGDILGRAGSFAGSGFTGPLGPGTYTVYVQQTGPATEYSLNFNVSGDGSGGGDGSGSGGEQVFVVDQISNPTLFSVPPTIDINGNLTYTPAPNAFGTSTFQVAAQVPNGGTTVLSEFNEATITVNPVNDPPTITTRGNVSVLEDSGTRTIDDFVTSFDAGPLESSNPNQTRVAFDEGDFGVSNPISIDNLNPTQLGTLSAGSNLISGFLETAFITGRVDVVTFTIPAGHEWTGLFVEEFEYLSPPGNDRAGFLGINNADFFPFDTDDLNINISPPVDQNLFLAGTTFGIDDLPELNGGNILPRSGQFAGRGFSGDSLPAGTYTIYTQQNGPQNRYTIDVQVTALESQSVVDVAIENVSNPELFSMPPTLDSQGALSFTPAENAFGVSTFEVIARDDGGVANGGQDQSVPTTITVNIGGINDAPSFVASNPPAVALGTIGNQVVPGFSQFIPGPENESGQSAFNYSVTNVSDPSAFEVLPAISESGSLSYTLVPDAEGVINFDVTLQDDGGTVQGGIDTSATQTFTLVVEDLSAPRDFGDAPSTFPVSLTDNGARHVISTLFLGSGVSADTTSLASALADGDDDDGVVQMISPFASATSDTTARLQINVSEAGLLNAWIDFNQDGDWDDAGEQIATNLSVVAGTQFVTYTLPGGAATGSTVGRFRVSTQANLDSTGAAIDGEVEDHLIDVRDPAIPSDISLVLSGTTLSVSPASDQFVIGDSGGAFWSAPITAARSIDLQGNATDDVVAIEQSVSDSDALPPLSFDGMDGFDQLQIRGYDEPIDVTAFGNAQLENLEQIDTNDGITTVLRVDVASVAALNTEQTLLVKANTGDSIEFLDSEVWRLGATGFVDGVFTRDVVSLDSTATIRTDLDTYWQNVIDPNDVNNDGNVGARDALVIINELARNSVSNDVSGLLAAPEDLPVWPGVYYDQDGNGNISAVDVTRLFDELPSTDDLASASASSLSTAGSLDAAEGELISTEIVVDQLAPLAGQIDLTPADTGIAEALPQSFSNEETENPLSAEFDQPEGEVVVFQATSAQPEDQYSSESLVDDALTGELDWRLDLE